MTASVLAGLMMAGCKSSSEKAAVPVDPTAGRKRHTIFYSANLWGDLLECG
jgi:hypothetical protein